MEKIETRLNGLIKETDKMVSVHFDSVTELLEHNYDESNINAERFHEYMEQQKHRKGEWLGHTNGCAKDVIKHALLGDEVLVKDLETKIRMFEKQIGAHRADYQEQMVKSKRKRIKRDFGSELDIHKVLQGKLDTAWSDMVRKEVDSIHPLVTVLVDLNCHAGEVCSDGYWRAAVAVHVVNELQQAGKSVKLVVADHNTGCMHSTNKVLTTSIVIKDFNQQLTMERVAAMCHYGFRRVFCFGAMHVQERKTTAGLGAPGSFNDSNLPIHLKEEVDAGHTKFLHIGRIKGSAKEAEQLLNSVHKQIGEYKN